MILRNALVAALLLVLVGTAWWVLGDLAEETPQASEAVASEEAPVGVGQGDMDELDYPLDYVDDLPLDDAPPLPDAVSEGYVPTFERPDLIGDGMLVPLEFEIEGPELDLGEAKAP